MADPKLFGGQPPQTSAAPGSPGLAAEPQMQMPVQNIDPGFAEFMQQNPHLDPTLAQQAYDYKKSKVRGLFPPVSQQPVDSYQNYANKATGRPSR